MKKIVRIASLLMLVVITLTMTSCEKVLHANMLEKTSWTQVRPTEYVGEDGYKRSGMKAFTLRFTSTTKGKLTTKFAKEGGESEETSAAFKYDFRDISGTITISEGEYAGKYNVAYSRCDDELILYGNDDGLKGAFSRD